MESEIQARIPGIDHVISEYSVGYLTHASKAYVEDADLVDQSPLSEAADTVTSLLLSASGDFSPENEAAIRNLVEKFISALSSANGVDTERRQMPFAAKKLDQTIHVGSQRNISSTLGLSGVSIDLEAAATRKVESRVDKKKLEKAEKKIRAKQDKKIMKNVEYEASKLLNEPDSTQSYEEFFMAVNPLQLGSDSQTKSKDIKVDGIDISIAGNRILTDTSLTLAYGRRYGLVGQNGIGKSTLLRALSKREVAIPTYISILHVEQEIKGDDTPALQAVLDADVWRKRLLADQDKISAQLASIDTERSTMADTSKDALRLDQEREALDVTLADVHAKLAEMESDKAEPRAASILAGLGFSPERQQYATKTFSGGWRMRLALARALFCEPDLLLLDEPSNMLDVPSITFLSNYLQTYPSTVLVVSHDRAFLNEVATDIIHQHSERLDYYRGANFDSFYATKEERKKNAKREYENQMAQRAHLQGIYNAAKASEAQSRIKKLERMPVLAPPESEYVVHFKFPDVEKLSPPIVQMTDVTFGYMPDKILLRNVDLDVQLDSRIGIVGPNGAGKTTVLKLLTNQLQPSSGLISQHPRLRIGFFAQHHVDALDMNTSAVGFMAKTYPGKTEEEYRRHLGAFGITGMTGLQKLELLSGGQKSRVAFACISLTNPHILVLDEPSNHLDIEAMDALSEALQNFQGGVLIVSHDVTLLQNVCTSFILFEIYVVRDRTTVAPKSKLRTPSITFGALHGTSDLLTFQAVRQQLQEFLMRTHHFRSITTLQERRNPRYEIPRVELEEMHAARDDEANHPSAPLLENHASPQREENADASWRLNELVYTTSGTWFIWALSLSAGISGLLFGYDTGVISSTLVSIKRDLSHRELTTLDKSLITSSTSLFALIASPVAGTLGDKLGRKPIILIADALFILGALWQAATSTVSGMIVGRSLVGLAVGTASLIAPLYIAELSPSQLRGRLVTILILFITGGQVVAYVVGWLLSTTTSGWRWMVGLGALPALVQLILLMFLPETPRWLVNAGNDGEARLVLGKVYGTTETASQEVDRVIRDIEAEINEEYSTSTSCGDLSANGPLSRWLASTTNNWNVLFTVPANRRALIIACMLQGFQQLCGFNSLMYFSATIFNILSFSSPTLTSLSVAVTNFLFTLLAFSLIDRIGRRRILLYSVPIMALSLILCAVAFPHINIETPNPADPPNATDPPRLSPILILISLTIYTASFASGLGNVPWQQSELFPLQVRSLGSALATATNWGSNFLVGLTFLPLMEFISPGWTFVIYACVCIVGWFSMWAIYPEMSGLGLEDVRGLLADGWGVRESIESFSKRQKSHIDS
ncbi:ATP-binding cassette, regulator of translational elongation [Ophidiomyces ophidiicola]|nr:ATP-binding cassette, regulator of translational elongation [Ophidiomyces ophidiicola]